MLVLRTYNEWASATCICAFMQFKRQMRWTDKIISKRHNRRIPVVCRTSVMVVRPDTRRTSHEVSATDTWNTLVGSCLQCRGASATWLVSHWWHLASSTLISVWSCCTPGPWSASTWCSASDGGYLRRQKANGQMEKTTSTRFGRMPTPYRYLRCGDLRSPGVMERRNGPLGPGLFLVCSSTQKCSSK